MNFLQILSLPLAFLYGIATSIRNRLYNNRLLHSTEYKIATISMGNLSTGGTGKSPHVDYLVKLFKKKMNIAVISRGYGRKTSGFFLAKEDITYREIGDEPLQLFRRHPDVPIAVDEERRRGIRKLLADYPDLDVIVLDDAHQHRSIKPGLSVILTDYNNLYTDDRLLPAGNLRESKRGALRADIILVTKCPVDLKPIQRNIILKNIAPQMYQKVFFSFIRYTQLVPFSASAEGSKLKLEPTMTVLLVTGIANPTALLEHLDQFRCHVEHVKFRDHYAYSVIDVRKVVKIFDNIAAENKVVLTTEKDAMRLMPPELKSEINSIPVYFAEMEVDFFPDDREEFNAKITQYAEENRRNRKVHQGAHN